MVVVFGMCTRICVNGYQVSEAHSNITTTSLRKTQLKAAMAQWICTFLSCCAFGETERNNFGPSSSPLIRSLAKLQELIAHCREIYTRSLDNFSSWTYEYTICNKNVHTYVQLMHICSGWDLDQWRRNTKLWRRQHNK